MLARAERDTNAALAPGVVRAVANQNAAPPHLLDECGSRSDTRENEIRLAAPELNRACLQRLLQARSRPKHLTHISANIILIGQRIGQARQRRCIYVVR